MNIELRHILTSAVVLGLFGMAGAGIVATTNELTADKIERNRAEARMKLLREVLPMDQCNNDILESEQALPLGSVTENSPAQLFLCREDNQIAAVALEVTAPGGYSGGIRLLVGILANGSVQGVRVLAHKETPGLGDKIELRKSDWVLSFNGKAMGTTPLSQWAVKRDGGMFDQFTGATITPRAVTQSVRDSLIYFNEQRDNLVGTKDG